MNLTQRQLYLFWIKVEKTDGCWIWKGVINKNGYGIYTVPGKNWRVHRLSYMFVNGYVDSKYDIHHECKNKICLNPAHLRVIDHEEHLILHGRMGKTHCKRGHARIKENLYLTTSKNGKIHGHCKPCRKLTPVPRY